MSFAYWRRGSPRLALLQRVVLVLFVFGCACGGGGGSSNTGTNGSGSQPQVEVSITPPSTTLAPQATQQFKATVTGSSDTLVGWQVVEQNGGTVDFTGLYQAPSVKGVYHVIAVTDADPSVYAEAIVSVPNSSGNGSIGIQ